MRYRVRIELILSGASSVKGRGGGWEEGEVDGGLCFLRGENLGLNSDGKESVQVERLWVQHVDRTVLFTS